MQPKTPKDCQRDGILKTKLLTLKYKAQPQDVLFLLLYL